jgi:hypothetical protein
MPCCRSGWESARRSPVAVLRTYDRISAADGGTAVSGASLALALFALWSILGLGGAALLLATRTVAAQRPR